MNKVSFDQKQWDTFWRVWERRLETLPGAKKAALLKSGLAVQALLHKQIDARFLNSRGKDKRGKRFPPNEQVKRWQELRLGSGGGYTAISPKNVIVRSNKTMEGSHTAQVITRSLEHGHKIRPPSGRWQRYRPRIKGKLDTNRKHRIHNVVPGRMFYSWAKKDATRVAVNAAREEIHEWIEGFAEGEK